MKCSRYAPVVGMVVATLVGAAWGSYDYVGSGENFAKVLVEFSDGAVVAFGVSFTDPSTTGIDMMDIIEADSTLTTERVYYGEPLGWMITGIFWDGHGDSGYGGGDLWWHYWVQDPPDAWLFPNYGASNRIAADGCADGWIYGHSNPPGLPGDATSNLVVDGGDLAIVGGNWFQTGMSWSEGDFNDDGKVDGGDLALMGGNWMFGVAPSPAPLPEPSAAVLLVVTAPLLRRRRAR